MESRPKPLSLATVEKLSTLFDRNVGQPRSAEATPGIYADRIEITVEDGVGKTIFVDKRSGEEV